MQKRANSTNPWPFLRQPGPIVSQQSHPNALIPRPAATVALLRDTASGLQTLMLRRNKALAWAGGSWVFPGGAIDEDDFAQAGGDACEAARLAARREAQEEAGIAALGELIGMGQWVTPLGESRRFATEYFVAACDPSAAVVVDGSEIVEGCWLTLEEALLQHHAGRLPLFPPTWLTLRQLRHFRRVADALHGYARLDPLYVEPVFSEGSAPPVALFEGDAGYTRRHAAHDGPRHRIWPIAGRWHYEYVGVDAAIRPLDGRDIPGRDAGST